MQQEKILAVIKEIKKSNSVLLDVFTKGSCLNFFFILRHIDKRAIPYTNEEHVITKIGKNYYDITGQISKEEVTKKKYICLYNNYADAYKTLEALKEHEMYKDRKTTYKRID